MNGENVNLFTGYGRISSADIITNSGYLNNQDRKAQHDAQLYHCITNSLTPEAEQKILAERDVYHINGQPSGPLLFKLLMQKVIINNWAISSLMRNNLSNLDSV